ncbi:hypothetical protein H6F43_16740 [Leptolyngbya sp. FACHB-36]|uniref:hypothetical protein n=1 Tax=Leptolyngbya sp. FACHB-36 TaxID=2692808 RepID=UPI0016810AB2|nr:hypothetical protein [Leptolyngbya sp. FACHB-36]MBD2021830.1 hypothetical protein [Leptolyngbya sp. FACHB-36]
MQFNRRFLALFISTIVALLLISFPLSAQSRLTEQSKLAIDGIGPIRIGMTIAQAEKSAGVQLVEKGARAGSGGCYFLSSKSGPADLGFMVISNREDERIDRTRDRIARVDVYRSSRITTVSGAKIGDTEARVKSLYAGRIQVMPHKYTGDRGGRYLTFVPNDAADRNYRLVFETLNGRVTLFRSGKLPEVEFVEGCA